MPRQSAQQLTGLRVPNLDRAVLLATSREEPLAVRTEGNTVDAVVVGIVQDPGAGHAALAEQDAVVVPGRREESTIGAVGNVADQRLPAGRCLDVPFID